MLPAWMVMGLMVMAGVQDPQREQDLQDPTPVADVIVEGRMMQARERAVPFVRAAIAPARGRTPARWPDQVCVGVLNLEGEAARYMADRISTVAADLGLRLGAQGCEPNVLIALTDDGDTMARQMVAARPRDFVTGASGTDRGKRALEEFQNSGAAVRWWHVSLPVDSFSGRPTVRMPGQMAANVDIDIERPSQLGSFGQSMAGSRLINFDMQTLQQVVVIVDVAMADGVGLVQLTDYVAVVAMAQIDPGAELVGYDTILNLFAAPGDAPPFMTDWDWAFLHGLYGDEVLSTRGTGTIADAMARRLVTGGPEND